MKNLILTCILLLGIFQISTAQYIVKGHVTDAESGKKIGGVIVAQKNSIAGTVTNVNGYYEFETDKKEAVIIFKGIHRKVVEAIYNGQKTLNVELEYEDYISDSAFTQKLAFISRNNERTTIELGFASIFYDDGKGGYSGKGNVRVSGKVPPEYKIYINGRKLTVNNKIDTAFYDVQINTTTIYSEGWKKETLIFINDKKANKKSGILKYKGNKSPIFIVDGKRVETIDELSPDSIESISVLKDKATTKIYGKEAELGVIIIVTKNKKDKDLRK